MRMNAVVDAYHILPDATRGQFWKPNPAAGARTSLEAAASTELGDATGKDGGDSFVAIRTEPEKLGVKMAAPEGAREEKDKQTLYILRAVLEEFGPLVSSQSVRPRRIKEAMQKQVRCTCR